MPAIPKLRVPIQMGQGSLATVEQDSVDNVAACVYVILAYPLGSRIEDVEFGIPDPTFEQLPLDVDDWLSQVAIYEPRASVSTSQEVEELVGDVLVEVGKRP